MSNGIFAAKKGNVTPRNLPVEWSGSILGQSNGVNVIIQEGANMEAMLETSWGVSNVDMFNYAVGGSSLGVVPSGSHWNRNGGTMYNTLHQNYNNFTNSQISAGKIPLIKFAAWVQGETDTTFPENAANYYENLKSLYLYLRILFANPDLIFIPMRLNINYKANPTSPTLLQVRAAVEKLDSEFGNVHYFNTDDISLSSDNVHYNNPERTIIRDRILNIVNANT